MKFQIKTVTILIVSIFLFFIMSCYVPPNNLTPGQTPIPGQTQASKVGNNTDTGQQTPYQNFYPPREPISDDDRKHSRKSDDSCEEKSSSNECYDLCQEIYPKDTEECLEESPDVIDNIYNVYRALKKANDLEDFNKINLNGFDSYVSVDTSSLISLIRDYSRGDADSMLEWVSENSRVAEILRGEENENFRILDDLLNLGEFDVPFEDSEFMDYALKNENDEALDYFFEYIFSNATGCSTKISTKCLETVCKIGRNTNVSPRHRYLYFRSLVFKDFMRDIIKNKVNFLITESTNGPPNPNGWEYGSGAGAIDSVNDLVGKNHWANNTSSAGMLSVCAGL